MSPHNLINTERKSIWAVLPEVMGEEEIKNSFALSKDAGLICPSSPAGVGFFFVKKKYGSLRPCIDYSPLNDITIKNRYPLLLMSSVFDQLHQASVHQVRPSQYLPPDPEGDELKTGINMPSGHYE